MITDFYLDPPIPTMGEQVCAYIEITNQGNSHSGIFDFEWYGLSTASAPTHPGFYHQGLASGESNVIRLYYTFKSWYPINKTTVVYVDMENNVDESNEDNNSASIYPFGVYKP